MCVGLAILLILFLQAQAVLAGIAFADVSWSTYSGYFRWVGGFAGGTLVPYAVKHWRAVERAVTEGGGSG